MRLRKITKTWAFLPSLVGGVLLLTMSVSYFYGYLSFTYYPVCPDGAHCTAIPTSDLYKQIVGVWEIAGYLAVIASLLLLARYGVWLVARHVVGTIVGFAMGVGAVVALLEASFLFFSGLSTVQLWRLAISPVEFDWFTTMGIAAIVGAIIISTFDTVTAVIP